MYKVTIEEIVGEVKRVTTLETEDLDLVKLVLQVGKVTQVSSDVDNLNIDKDWQELLQWWKDQKVKPLTLEEQLKKVMEEMRKARPIGVQPQPDVSPFSKPYDSNQPFTVTC